MESILEGLRYVRQSSVVQSVLVRTGVFSPAATAIWALMPLLAQPFGSTGFGFLVGSFGVGALAGAIVLPRIRPRMSLDGLIAAAIVALAAVTVASGRVHQLGWLCLVMFIGGTAWIGILASFNYAAQTMAPTWVRARSLSCTSGDAGRMSVGSAILGSCSGKDRRAGSVGLGGLTFGGRPPYHRSHRLSFLDLELAPAVVPGLTAPRHQVPSARSLWHSRAIYGQKLPLDSMQFHTHFSRQEYEKLFAAQRLAHP